MAEQTDREYLIERGWVAVSDGWMLPGWPIIQQCDQWQLGGFAVNVGEALAIQRARDAEEDRAHVVALLAARISNSSPLMGQVVQEASVVEWAAEMVRKVRGLPPLRLAALVRIEGLIARWDEDVYPDGEARPVPDAIAQIRKALRGDAP